MTLPDTSRLSFDEKRHAYTLDGKKLLSGVTSVISETSSKGALVQWAANEACKYLSENFQNFVHVQDDHLRLDSEEWISALELARTAHTRKKDKAASKGTDTHELVEAFINFCLTGDGYAKQPLTVEWPSIAPFVRWAVENKVQFIAAEQRLYSEKWGYAGTADFLAIIDGKLTVGDLKSFPKMWSADPFIQCGAYSLAYHEMTGHRPEQTVIVKMCDPEDERLKKYGGQAFSVYPRFALEEDEDMFLTRLKMYRYNENFVSPSN